MLSIAKAKSHSINTTLQKRQIFKTKKLTQGEKKIKTVNFTTNFYMSFGFVNFATHLQQATGPSFTTLQRKNKRIFKTKRLIYHFKRKA